MRKVNYEKKNHTNHLQQDKDTEKSFIGFLQSVIWVPKYLAPSRYSISLCICLPFRPRCNYRNKHDKYNICVAFGSHSACCPTTTFDTHKWNRNRQPTLRLGLGAAVGTVHPVLPRTEYEYETGTGTGTNKDRNLTLQHEAVNSRRVEEDWLPPSNCLPLTGWKSCVMYLWCGDASFDWMALESKELGAVRQTAPTPTRNSCCHM